MMTQYYLEVTFTNANFHTSGFYFTREKQTEIARSWLVTNLHTQGYKNLRTLLIDDVNEIFPQLLLTEGDLIYI